MDRKSHGLQRRIEAIRLKIGSLLSLRKMVALSPSHDITNRQWSVLESQLSSVHAKMMSRLKHGARTFLPHVQNPRAARQLHAMLGKIELDMSKAFTFFDTYMDVLTQRHTPELGPILGGCDVMAWDSINKRHPALSLVEPPLVYCERGFGAATLREGVHLPGGIPNPLPLIQIPYSRLKEKYNLTSILHEVGHQAMDRLDLVSALPKAIRSALKKKKAPDEIVELFALWSHEIGPDFWAFCDSGIAQAGGIREILGLPSNQSFRVSFADPHPPPYLRALLSFEWCRQMWGKGLWDKWEAQWIMLYPLKAAPRGLRKLLKKAWSYIPIVSKVLFNKNFPELNQKTIPGLFNLSALAPSKL